MFIPKEFIRLIKWVSLILLGIVFVLSVLLVLSYNKMTTLFSFFSTFSFPLFLTSSSVSIDYNSFLFNFLYNDSLKMEHIFTNSFLAGNTTNIQFYEELLGWSSHNFFNGLVDNDLSITFSLLFAIDGINIFFVFLTTLVCFLCYVYLFNNLDNIYFYNSKLFILIIISLEFFVLLSFTVMNLLFFFIFFEVILIPMFILILVGGSRDRKVKASFYFFYYTAVGSLFLLVGIFVIYFLAGTLDIIYLYHLKLGHDTQLFLWPFFFFAFAIKIPVFPFHIWLPEAHVEAPTIGSVILASLLLKLGGYGFIRFMLPLFPYANIYYSNLINMFLIIGILYPAFVALVQIDLKRVIAYSSVSHMNFAVIGLFSQTFNGVMGSLILMVGHGFVSAALFFIIGILYSRYKTRLVYYYNGLVLVMPQFIIFFFLFILGNISFPGSINFIGELLIFIGLFSYNSVIFFLALLNTIVTAIYSFFFFNQLSFGSLNNMYIKSFSDINKNEFFILFSLVCLTFFFGLFPNFIIDFVTPGVDFILLASANKL